MKKVKVIQCPYKGLKGCGAGFEDMLRPYVENQNYTIKSAYYADGYHTAVLEKDEQHGQRHICC